jgi:hypothetical protein
MAVRFMIFIGWILSAFSFVIALAGLTTPGAGKLISLALIGWCLIFLPPLWHRTIKHGLPVNIVARAVAFFTLPLLFVAMATAIGYHSPQVADKSIVLPQKKPDPQSKPLALVPVKKPDKEPALAVKQAPATPVPKPIEISSECQKDFEAAASVDKRHASHQNIYPAIESCKRIDEFIAASVNYPLAVNNNEPKKYLAYRCSEPEVLGKGICKELPHYPGMKTTFFLTPSRDSTEPTPVSDKTTMKLLMTAAQDRDFEKYNKIANSPSVSLVEGEGVDIISNSGDLVQVRLHATDIKGKDLEGQVFWTSAEFVQTNYEYVK